ncbi:MAG: integral membrane sensor signal transduction histidine kinase [Candidatus Roizmanbacteria bacterium GW2011_GWA2_37_7]|uniref:histidine kinase n=1 Tax=Candidatus Roizmanbacteria bacterium GW2011_GWA2_37_7 TaxID=1618481 RepID=A0A0G0JM26_9BACT|nr:MAG: integral membrane sensor signal transduction histidine kinase [Candidatus Roizmanbacteria bacterium GW2011_GWA2_37_7]
MFQFARIKLTLWYLLIIMTISMAFSAIIFDFTTREVHRFASAQRHRIQELLELDEFFFSNRPRKMPLIIEIDDEELITEVQKRTLISLGIVNGIIFVLAGGLSYFLAGKTLQPIQEMVDEQNRFISDASHELKTPLTSLKTAFEVFLRDKNPQLTDSKELIQESLIDVNKLQYLSEALLTLAQFQQPSEKHTFSRLNLNINITSTIKKIGPLAKTKRIAIKINLNDLYVTADQYKLSEVWIILLDNAIKYSPEKSTIIITAKKSGNCAEIRVSDQGIGISQKDLPHIFDRFYRADSARSHQKGNGFGLGLAIAKKIVEQHRGTITVTSNEEKGSTFIVKLPLLKK